MSHPDPEDNLTRQRELYGAPLGDSVRRITSSLGISQAAVARTIGMSAPMLSQLVSGQRVKVGNALALQRLQSLLDLTDEVAAGLAHEAVAERLRAIGAEDSTTLTTRRRDAAAPTSGPDQMHRLLRAVASGRDLAGAAAILDTDFPAIAEVLRVYGTGTADEAAAHWAALAPLL